MTADVPAPSPLVEADPNSLNEVMNRDPLEYKRQDRDQIVAELRRMRGKWLVEEAAGKTRASKPKKDDGKSVMTLGDLGL